MRFLRSHTGKHEERKVFILSLDPPILLNVPSRSRSTHQTVFNHSSYPKLEFMKAISTFTTLFLIIITCAVSAVLYLNENYTISAVLTIVWIVALTLWIGKCMGFVDLFINKTLAKH
jgi:hypothetical protein